MRARGQQLALVVVFLFLGTAFSLVYGLWDRDHLGAKAAEMVHVAQNLVRNGEFGNPFPARDTGATAVVAPAHPIFLAMLLLAFGPVYGGMAILLSGALICGLHAALLVQLSRTVFRDQRPGIWAAILASALPTIRFMPVWEAMSAATGLLAFCIMSACWLEKGRATTGRFLFLGAMAGFMVLVNPVAAIVPLIWAALLLHEHWRDLKHPITAVACFGLTLILTPLPWAVRSQIVLGAPVIKNTLGMTLDAANNDCASSSFVQIHQSGCYDRHHPYNNRVQADLVASMGEVNYDASRLRTALGWIRSNPGAFLRLTAWRTFEFWFPNKRESPYAYTISVITLLSLAGFVLMARRGVSFLRFAAWASLLYPLAYYIVYSDSRFRIPILWISLLGAGYFLQSAWERLESWRAGRPLC